MGSNNDWYKNPGKIIALGFGGGAVLAGLGWALAQIIPAFGAAVGIAISIATAGLAAGAVASWVVPAAASGLAAAGTVGALVVIVRILKSTAREPFAWSLPILGVAAGFLVDISTEFHPEAPVVRILFAGTAAVLVVIGGFLWTRRGWMLKSVAVFFFLGPPVVILLSIVSGSDESGLRAAIGAVSATTWILIVLLLGVAFAIAILARKFGPEPGP